MAVYSQEDRDNARKEMRNQMQTSAAISNRIKKPTGIVSKMWLETRVAGILGAKILFGLIKLPFQIVLAPGILLEEVVPENSSDFDAAATLFIIYIVMAIVGGAFINGTHPFIGAAMIWPIAASAVCFVKLLIIAGIEHGAKQIALEHQKIRHQLSNNSDD